MRCQLLLVVAALLVNGPAMGGENQSPGRPLPTKKLGGTQYAEARAATNRANLMRAELEERMRATKGVSARKQGPAVTSGEFDAEAAAVARAYQEVIDRYPHTEVALDCALRLSGLLQYQRKYDEAAELSARTADEFVGTPEGLRAIFNTGLIHAQARHDPLEATRWFERIPRPTKPPGAPYDFADKLYLAAQEQLIKCELTLGQDDQAKQRAASLKEALPELRDEVDRFLAFELGSRVSMRRATKSAHLEGVPRAPVDAIAFFLIGSGGILFFIGWVLLVKHKEGARP